jgi:hypothetical protein
MARARCAVQHPHASLLKRKNSSPVAISFAKTRYNACITKQTSDTKEENSQLEQQNSKKEP